MPLVAARFTLLELEMMMIRTRENVMLEASPALPSAVLGCKFTTKLPRKGTKIALTVYVASDPNPGVEYQLFGSLGRAW